jgi:agmatinase
VTQPNASLPHTGIATFCKAPYVTDLDALDAEVAIMGVPFDAATGMRPGCRQAPRAIRDASTRFGFLGRTARSEGYFDVSQDRRRLAGVRLADVGDADVTNFNLEHNARCIAEMVQTITERGALPVIIGGDHSISFPAVSGLSAAGALTVVLFDAHLDYRDEVMGQRFTNNSPFRRIHELPFVRQIITIGVRGIKSTDRELLDTLSHGNLVFTSAETVKRGADAILEQLPSDIGPYYVSIDIDVLDPSIAPGTESPEAEGLTYTHVKEIVRGISERGTMVGLDLVEVNPYLDHSELTQHIAAQLLIEAIATRFP